MLKSTRYILEPRNGRKSFYGKATVIEVENGCKLLKSYDTIVCYIDKDRNFHRTWEGYSVTTMTHINSFIDEQGISGGGKAWWDKQEDEGSPKWLSDMKKEMGWW